MISLKVKNKGSITKIISLIRKFDKNLSLSEIKQKIENDEAVIFHDISEEADIIDELNGVDRNALFCKLIQDLEKNGAEIELYEDESVITKEILYNMMESWVEISNETELDIERELNRK